jgi:acyl carrier protein
MSDAQHRIHEFVQSRIPRATVIDDEDIFAIGFVNSLFAMELVIYLEKEFDLVLPNDELKLDNFRTVTAMAALVERLSASTRVPVAGS